jgi:hypothetical protein
MRLVHIAQGKRRSVEWTESPNPEAVFHSYWIAKVGMLNASDTLTEKTETLRLAGREAGSYTGGPANWRFLRWGRPLVLTFLGLSNRACKSVSIDYRLVC